MEASSPGCFGAPSIFNFRSEFCLSCVHFRECRRSVFSELKRAPQVLAVTKMIVEHSRYEEHTGEHLRASAEKAVRPSRATRISIALTEAQKAVVSSQPLGVGVELDLIYRRGLDVLMAQALVLDNDYFFTVNRNAALNLAVKMLPNSFTRKELKNAITDRFGWSQRSAWSKTSLIWSILKALGVAAENEQRLVMHPNLFNHNNNSQHLKG